jgi:p-aminobenzoyl-glutamate transporter AbgT
MNSLFPVSEQTFNHSEEILYGELRVDLKNRNVVLKRTMLGTTRSPPIDRFSVVLLLWLQKEFLLSQSVRTVYSTADSRSWALESKLKTVTLFLYLLAHLAYFLRKFNQSHLKNYITLKENNVFSKSPLNHVLEQRIMAKI